MRTTFLLLIDVLTTGTALARPDIADYITAGLVDPNSSSTDSSVSLVNWTPTAPAAVSTISVVDVSSAAAGEEVTTTITVTAGCPAPSPSFASPSDISLVLTTFEAGTTSLVISGWTAPITGGTSAVAPPIPTSSVQPTWSPPANPLTPTQQAGDSILGTLSQLAFPKWLPKPDGLPYNTPPWGKRTTKNSDATVKSDIPNTNVTRHYTFHVRRTRLSPDGVLRDMIVVNNQYPGPTIEANWGDWIEVTVYNEITAPEEGTAMHWHGMLQRATAWEDGTPGVSQCPIAPGESYTYRFQAEVYGTSFWHAHYSAQYTAGVKGAMVIYGPWQEDYDVDLGPVLLGDWNHIPYFSMVQNVVGTDISKIPPLSDNGLVNGRGRFDCSKPSYSNSSDWLATNLPSDLVWTCVDGADRAKFKFRSGKTHRLRLVNGGADGVQKFSIDGHTMTVIATDYVPVIPYVADIITLGVGQRTDVLVTATQDPSSSWYMRSQLPGQDICGGQIPGPTGTYPQVLAEIYYDAADTTIEPTSFAIVNDISCTNSPLNITQPEYAVAPSPNPTYLPIVLGITVNATGNFNFLVNNQTYRANFNDPLLYNAADGITSYPDNPEYNMYDMGNATSIVLNVTNFTPFVHPFHLHGYTFFVLSVGDTPGVWDGSVTNPTNPMRRDVQIVAAGSWMALQFEAENAGVWPFHCHAAWHLSGGLGMSLLTRAGDLGGLPAGGKAKTCDAWGKWTATDVVDQIDSGS